MKNKITIVKLMVGITLLSILIYKVGFGNLIDILLSTNPLAFLVIVALAFFQILFSSFNIKLISSALNYELSYSYLFKSYTRAWSFGKFMPGGLGELSIAYFLKKKGVPIKSSFFVAVFDKILTIISLSLISLIGVWVFFPTKTSIILSILIAFFVLGIFALLLSKSIRKLLKRLILKKYYSKFKGLSKKLDYMFSEKKRFLLANLMVTLIKSFFAAVIITFLFILLGIEINIFHVLIINSLTVLVSMVPVTIAGLGTKEATAVFLYSLLGIEATVVLGAYILIRLVTMLIAIILFMIPQKRISSAV